MHLARGISTMAIVAATLAAGPAWGSLHAGDVAPNFTKYDLTGTPHTLSSYLGKVVVLNILGYS